MNKYRSKQDLIAAVKSAVDKGTRSTTRSRYPTGVSRGAPVWAADAPDVFRDEYAVQNAVYKPSKLLTDPYEACMKWAFGADWSSIGEPTARMQWEFRHHGLALLPSRWDDCVRLITRLWAEAVRSGAVEEVELKDAIEKAAGEMGG